MLDGEIKKLDAQEARLHGGVAKAFPDSSVASIENLRNTMLDIAADLGGDVSGMTASERKLYNAVTETKKPFTYGRLERERQAIGRALQNKDSVYSNADRSSLSRLYAALAEDKKESVSKLGSPVLREVLDVANSLTQKRKGLEGRVVEAFGSDTQGSIGNMLRTATQSAAKGDIKNLNKVINTVPKELRREAILSGIAASSRSQRALEPGFGFAEFSKLYNGIKNNRPIYNKIASEVGTNTMRTLEDLSIISERITRARANVLQTGKANQAFLQGLNAEKLVERVMNTTTGKTAVQAAATGIGAVTGGPVGAFGGAALTDFLAKSQPDRVKAAGRLFNSDEFKDLVTKITTGQQTPNDINKVTQSTAFQRWAKITGVNNPSGWLQGVIQATTPSQPLELTITPQDVRRAQ